MSTANRKTKDSNQPEPNNDTSAQPKERHVPTPEERKLVESFFEKRKEETPPPKMKAEKDASGTIGIRSEHKDGTVAHALLAKALGTADADFISGMLTQLASVTTGKGQEVNEENLNFVRCLGVFPRYG
jgi:hypothetical protein